MIDTLMNIWWAWASFGVILALAEMIVPAFVFLGFGIGAMLTALLLLVGLAPSGAVLMLTFAVLSLISWLALRHFFKPKHNHVKTFDRDINDH